MLPHSVVPEGLSHYWAMKEKLDMHSQVPFSPPSSLGNYIPTRNFALLAPSRTEFVEICFPWGDPAQLVLGCRWLCNSGVYCEEVQFLLDLVFISNKSNILFSLFQHLYFMYSYFKLGWVRDIFPEGKFWKTSTPLPSCLWSGYFGLSVFIPHSVLSWHSALQNSMMCTLLKESSNRHVIMNLLFTFIHFYILKMKI